MRLLLLCIMQMIFRVFMLLYSVFCSFPVNL